MDTSHASLSFFQGFWIALRSGDPAMVLIFASLLLSLALSIERSFRLFVTYAVDAAGFMSEVQKHLLANDVEGALRVCNGAPQAALSRVVKAGLQRASRPTEQIQNAIDASSLEVIPQLEKRLPYLALIANVATLFGLLGTIMGLIRSFAAIALADATTRQALLGKGISEAMSATAFGLIVAILTMILHSVLTTQANRLIEHLDEYGVKLLDLLSARRSPHAPKT